MIGLEQRLEVVLLQEPERGLERALLRRQEQALFRVLEQGRGLGQGQEQAEGLGLVLRPGRRPE